MRKGGETSGYGFGTFQGVFTPSILTIIGVVMYLRFGCRELRSQEDSCCRQVACGLKREWRDAERVQTIFWIDRFCVPGRKNASGQD